MEMIVKQKLPKEPLYDRTNTILFTANTAWYLYNFRVKLATALRATGYRVVMVAPSDQYAASLRALGFEFIHWNVPRTGRHPLRDLRCLWQLLRIYNRETPVAVHHFTLKCVLLGSIAAKLTRVPKVFNAITGLGHLFLGEGFRSRALRFVVLPVLRAVFDLGKPVMIFQNSDDRQHFTRLHLSSPERSWEIPTSGIDTTYYSPTSTPPASVPIVLFAGRILREKGVREFVEAARILKQSGHDARFLMAGAPDHGNPSSFSAAEIDAWRADGLVEPLGHVSDLRTLLSQAAMLVLPSYREGGSRVILEASAMQLPVVTTDVPGCRNLVDQGETGLIVPVRNAVRLADAISALLEAPELRDRFGRAGRAKVQREFSDEKVVAETIGVYVASGVSVS